MEVRLSSARFRDVVGNDSARIFIAEDLRAQRRMRELESRVAELEARLAVGGLDGRDGAEPAAAAWRRVRVLIVDGNEPWGEELAEVLASLGCIPVRCAAPEHAAAVLAEAGRPDGRSAWPWSLSSARAAPADWGSGRRFALWDSTCR